MTEENIIEGDLTIDAKPDGEAVLTNDTEKNVPEDSDAINTDDLEMKDEASGDDLAEPKVECDEASEEKVEGEESVPSEPQKIACKVARIPKKIFEYMMRFEEDDIIRVNVTQLRVWISTELFHLAKRVPDSTVWDTEECPILGLDVPKNAAYDIFVRSFLNENIEKEEKRIETDRETRKKLPSNFSLLSKKQKRRVIAQLTNEINKSKGEPTENTEKEGGDSDEIQPAKEKKTANAGSNKSNVANNRKEHSNKNIASRKRHINDSNTRGNKRGKPNLVRGAGIKRGSSGPKGVVPPPRNMGGPDRRGQDPQRKGWGPGFNNRNNMRKDWGPSPWNSGVPMNDTYGGGMINRHNYEQNYDMDSQRFSAFNNGGLRQGFESFDRSQSPSMNRFGNFPQFNSTQKNESGGRFMDDKYGGYNTGMEMMNNNFRGSPPGKFNSFPGMPSGGNMSNIAGYGATNSATGGGYVGSMMPSGDAYASFLNGYNNSDRDRNDDSRFNARRHDRR